MTSGDFRLLGIWRESQVLSFVARCVQISSSDTLWSKTIFMYHLSWHTCCLWQNMFHQVTSLVFPEKCNFPQPISDVTFKRRSPSPNRARKTKPYLWVTRKIWQVSDQNNQNLYPLSFKRLKNTNPLGRHIPHAHPPPPPPRNDTTKIKPKKSTI